MRTRSLILACCLTMAWEGVYSQRSPDQGQSLQERIDSQFRSNLNPELAPNFEMANRKFESPSNLQLDKKSGLKSAYDGSKSFDRMIRKETRSFLGIRNPWFGKKVFVTEDAFLKKVNALSKDGSTFRTKDAATKEFYDADKAMQTRNDPMPRPQVVPRGTAQGSIDSLEGKANQNLTAEQVRELLNKN